LNSFYDKTETRNMLHLEILITNRCYPQLLKLWNGKRNQIAALITGVTDVITYTYLLALVNDERKL